MTEQIAPIVIRMRRDQRQRGKLYLSIRKKLGLTQVNFGRYTGMTLKTVKYREMAKLRYTLDEIVKLQQISGMSWEDYGKLLEQLS